MDKVKTIKNYLQNQKKEWRLCQSSEAKYRMEVYDELLEVIDSLEEESVSEDLEGASEAHALKCHTKKASAGTLAASIYDFKAGADWMKEHLIEKACKFIRTPCIYVVDFNHYGGATTNYEATVEKFRKYMEEQQ